MASPLAEDATRVAPVKSMRAPARRTGDAALIRVFASDRLLVVTSCRPPLPMAKAARSTAMS
jgi:hypothetical protein